MVNQTPEALVLLRSWFVDLLNFAEKVTPVLTPANVIDEKPRMLPVVSWAREPVAGQSSVFDAQSLKDDNHSIQVVNTQ